VLLLDFAICWSTISLGLFTFDGLLLLLNFDGLVLLLLFKLMFALEFKLVFFVLRVDLL